MTIQNSSVKQSIKLIILQVAGILLGLVSVFWIAGSVPADVYAIVGIYQVISSILIVFSNTGLETHAIRNILSWRETKDDENIGIIITQAVILRTALAAVIFIPMIVYCYYISKYKFDSQYLGLFIVMSLFSIFGATNDSVSLILKAFNKYFESALVNYTINVFGRLLALLLFFKYGFLVYIYSIMLLPILITLPILYKIRHWIKFKYLLDRKKLVSNLNSSKAFTFSAYISFIFNSLDLLVVSVFLKPEIMGSFSIGKKLFSIAKSFIENIYDPLIQNLVKYKHQLDVLTLKLNRIIHYNKIIITISIVTFVAVLIVTNTIISAFNLTRYPYLNYFLISIYISQIAHLGMKIKFNFITLFYKSSYYIKLTIMTAIFAVIFFIIIILIDIKFIFLYIFAQNLLMIIYTNYVFKKNNGIAGIYIT